MCGCEVSVLVEFEGRRREGGTVAKESNSASCHAGEVLLFENVACDDAFGLIYHFTH